MAGSKGYAAILYQMGNSSFHGSIYRALLRRPGLVDLHDFNLAGFHTFTPAGPANDGPYFQVAGSNAP